MFKTSWKFTKSEGETNTEPSQTIPDQTMSIPELIRRYASGQSLGGIKVPIYDEEPENDILQGRAFATFDLSEQHQIIKSAKSEYEETVTRLRNYKPQVSEEVKE